MEVNPSTDGEVNTLIDIIDRNPASQRGIEAARHLRTTAVDNPALIKQHDDELLDLLSHHDVRSGSGILWESVFEALHIAVTDRDDSPPTERIVLLLEASVESPHAQSAAAILSDVLAETDNWSTTNAGLDEELTANIEEGLEDFDGRTYEFLRYYLAPIDKDGASLFDDLDDEDRYRALNAASVARSIAPGTLKANLRDLESEVPAAEELFGELERVATERAFTDEVVRAILTATDTDAEPDRSESRAKHGNRTQSNQSATLGSDDGEKSSRPGPEEKTSPSAGSDSSANSPDQSISEANQFATQCQAIDEISAVLDDATPVSTYAVVHPSQGSGIAFVVDQSVAGDEATTSAFERSVEQWSGIDQNPHVATVYDWGVSPRPWVVFDGGDRRLADGLPDVDHTTRLRVIESIRNGLQTGSLYNISHGGLDPVTVSLSGTGSSLTAFLSGWGLRYRVAISSDHFSPTPYTAPEQLDGEMTRTTDVYRAGALVYQLFTGREPYVDTDNIGPAIRRGDGFESAHTEGLPQRFDRIIERATTRDPADRYASPTDLLDAVRNLSL